MDDIWVLGFHRLKDNKFIIFDFYFTDKHCQDQADRKNKLLKRNELELGKFVVRRFTAVNEETISEV